VTEAHRCEQLARSCYSVLLWWELNTWHSDRRSNTLPLCHGTTCKYNARYISPIAECFSSHWSGPLKFRSMIGIADVTICCQILWRKIFREYSAQRVNFSCWCYHSVLLLHGYIGIPLSTVYYTTLMMSWSQQKSTSVRCGFHVQNPPEVDSDLLQDQNYQLL